jgi:hypothetical protein
MVPQRCPRQDRTHRGRPGPAIVRLRENAWAEFVPFLAFDTEIRKGICSTDAIDSVNARLRVVPLRQDQRRRFPTSTRTNSASRRKRNQRQNLSFDRPPAARFFEIADCGVGSETGRGRAGRSLWSSSADRGRDL